jgi:hypothetical protein
MGADGETARENPAIRSRATALSLFAFLLFVALSVTGLRAFYDWLAGSAGFVPPRRFASPPLVTIDDGVRDPGITAERAELEAYKWIDRDKGVLQTPIERAMAIVAARGSRAYDPIPAPKASP